MDNAITIQDTLVAKLRRYNPKCRNYYASITKAVKQARRELIYLGFEHHVDKIIQDCYDLAKLPTTAEEGKCSVCTGDGRLVEGTGNPKRPLRLVRCEFCKGTGKDSAACRKRLRANTDNSAHKSSRMKKRKGWFHHPAKCLAKGMFGRDCKRCEAYRRRYEKDNQQHD